jgi:hypothetical protein
MQAFALLDYSDKQGIHWIIGEPEIDFTWPKTLDSGTGSKDFLRLLSHAKTVNGIAILSGGEVSVQYQGLQHQTENIAIEIARLAVNQDETSKLELCKSAQPNPPVRVRACEILTDSVYLSAVEPVSLLGYTYILQADSRVGYGFYSQIDPR